MKQIDAKLMATQIFSIICASLMYKNIKKEKLDIPKLYLEYEKAILDGIKVERKEK